MKKGLSFLLPALLSLALLPVACKDYGKKVDIEGTKGEVYYKDDASLDEAQRLGNFLKQIGFLGNEKAASVQVDKKTGNYTVRFVYDKDYFEKTPGVEDFFKELTARMSAELFGGSHVDIVLSDKFFNDFKTIPYDAAAGTNPASTQ